MTRMRVAILAHLSEWSGAPAAGVRFADLLHRTGEMEVSVIFPAEGEAVQRARDLQLRVLISSQPVHGFEGGKIQALSAKLSGVYRLARLLRSEGIQVVWIHGMANIWLGLAARLARCRILWHGHELVPPGSERLGQIRKFLIGHLAHGVVFAGESARRNWMPSGRLGRAKAWGVLANPFDREEWSRLARAEVARPFPPGAGDAPVLLASGLFSRKGADRLLRGVAAWGRSARIILLGDERSDRENQQFIAELDDLILRLPPGVTVERPGMVSDVKPWLAQAHAFVSLSRSEVAPILLVEAMASGVPVVVSDVGEQAAMVNWGERGWVVEHGGNPEAVAAALQDCIADQDGNQAERCERARAWALGTHDPEAVADRAREILQGLLQG